MYDTRHPSHYKLLHHYMFTFAFSSALRSATFQLEYSTEDMVANCIRGLSEKWVISLKTVNKSFCFWWQWPFSSYCNCTQTEQQTHKIFVHSAHARHTG